MSHTAKNDPGCYICRPNDPDAAEEGCSTCDREFWAAALAVSRALSQRPLRRVIPPAIGDGSTPIHPD